MQEINDNHPLDLSYLISMVGHNPYFIIEIFDTFIEQTPIYLAELDNALALKNWEDVGNCAHKLKPTFSYVGRDDVKELVMEIEMNARNLVIDQIPADIARLNVIVQKIYIQLDSAKKDIQFTS
ncbi:HPt (histidine-containing phosphotransfer) domain-containing protein [Pedobacter psychrotolerans]|uniref:HPt (Histidine-containing phosphotransfer) domain-containing protein n=1 Tax=Pedobacter psychrotolerans TaxID=1843235 RepID=A0A4R2HPD3_9SPHI|nr:Hpt domain-containing protein [Pedobacter psychrotolerans]TCO31294.1 HPt (histidine-containing phosphotransfer) domain-containing protein [Pedobacter psychrotolerans]GGE40780.1 hypothetical protein GCM10011413_03270 [Pedobacter psychrotolerans]